MDFGNVVSGAQDNNSGLIMDEAWHEDIRDQAMQDRPAAATEQGFLRNTLIRSSRIGRIGEERVHGISLVKLC